MKKIRLLILTVLFAIPFTVQAATSPSVKTLEATTSGSTINYNGTMEDGSTAVMCKLYNSDNEEIDLLSSAVDDHAFSGNFANIASGTYNVACANYEGGEVKKVEVVITDSVTTETTSNNPKTYDAGLTKPIAILTISAIGIVGSIVYLKKKQKTNK